MGRRALSLVFGRGGDLIFFSRNEKRLNDRYPELAPAFARCATSSFIADGEIVAFRGGLTSFMGLQKRMQVEHPSGSLLREVPVYLFLFDLLYLNGYEGGSPVSQGTASGIGAAGLRQIDRFARITRHCSPEAG